jgi:Uncharacterized protein conserved in bacteria (DUF2314)
VTVIRETYILAVREAEPLGEAALREAFEAEDVTLEVNSAEARFSVRSEQTTVVVRFESRLNPLGWTPELLTGGPELRAALEQARGFYRVGFEPNPASASVAVFEALWTVRTLLELSEGVVVDVAAFKLHSSQDVEELTELDFDIRDHVTIHAVELGEHGKLWVHSHGLSKFGSPDVEMFGIDEDDLPAAETFFHELCADLAFAQGPQPRQIVSTSVGRSFTLLPLEEGRGSLYRTTDPEAFDGHQTGFLTVVSEEGRHAMGEILEQYRERFEAESDEETRVRQTRADKLLPSFKARFQRRGLMEPLTFLVRAPFEVHPDGEAGETEEEQLWVEVVQWDQSSLVGRLVDGGQSTTEWRKGSHVEVDDGQITSLGLSREGRALEPDEMEALLQAERPA